MKDFLDKKSDVNYDKITKPGISVEIIREISKAQNEPKWMLDYRLESFKYFQEKPMTKWGPDLSELDLNSIYYYAKPEGAGNKSSWEDVPENIKNTFDRLGIPEAEKKSLAGVGAQYDSEVVYHSLKKELQEKGVIFEDMSIALQKHPEIVKKYFGKCIPFNDHKFASLHYSVWSGGTFMYVPENIELNEPLQSYFRMNTEAGGQFEHTLIVIEKGAKAHYIEGCSAPKFNTNSLHAGGVEIFVGEGAEMRYSSVENWSTDTYNLNTKRGIVDKDGYLEWVGGQLGSGVTMLYPCSILKGDNSKADHLSIAIAGKGQNQDTGAKVIHIGENTSSNILSKSISKDGGISTYRGLVEILPKAKGSINKTDCDGLILDSESISNAIPDIKVGNSDTVIAHEAKAGKINEKELFYLMSRGISEEEAMAMIVNGFLSPVMKELPLEYASELNVLISMEFEGGI